MKNFNKKDVDRLEKLSSTYFNKFKTVPRFSKRNVFISLFTIGGLWLMYKHNKISKKEQQQYVNIFQWKQKLSQQALLSDIYEKVQQFFKGDQFFATKKYQQLLTTRFTQDILVETFRVSEDKPKKQFILTQHIQHKLNLKFLKLHTHKSRLLIDQNSHLVKRSCQIPVIFFGVPFGTKQRQFNKGSKKMKTQKSIQSKARFELNSQCKKINKLNGYFLDKAQKKQLLFECKKRIEKIESSIMKQLIENFKIYLQAQRQYDKEQQEISKSFRLQSDIIK